MQELKYYIIYKPFNVLSQFTNEGGKQCLKDYFELPIDVYPVGRLDYDSEGLLILTNDNRLKTTILSPKSRCKKTYFAQVEGEVNFEAIRKLEAGIDININGKIHHTGKAVAEIISEPNLPERNPPIRFRKNIPTTWIKLSITEGKNRQVRKMTAAVGYPTLRLVRHSIENLNINGFSSGQLKELEKEFVYKSLKIRI